MLAWSVDWSPWVHEWPLHASCAWDCPLSLASSRFVESRTHERHEMIWRRMETHMRSSVAAWIGVVLGCVPLAAQSRAPAQVRLSNALPPDARPRQVAASVCISSGRNAFYVTVSRN